jgi:hypothetical protein
MAQENANILHAAIAIRYRSDELSGSAKIIAATGIEIASVYERQDLPNVAPIVFQLDLVTGIDDSELVCSWMSGPAVPPNGDPPAAVRNLDADDIMRPPLDFDSSAPNLEKRRFWITANQHTLYVAWWRIPPIAEASIPLIELPPGP